MDKYKQMQDRQDYKEECDLRKDFTLFQEYADERLGITEFISKLRELMKRYDWDNHYDVVDILKDF